MVHMELFGKTLLPWNLARLGMIAVANRGPGWLPLSTYFVMKLDGLMPNRC